jgi:hypothetical protein
MPQGPLALQVVPYPALATSLNITTATVLKVGKGVVGTVYVQVAGSGTGTINDVATNAPAAANQIGIIPAAVGLVVLNFPYLVGLLIVPGAGQTVSVSFQ